MKNSKIIVIILVVIIIALIFYIVKVGNSLYKQGEMGAENKGVLVLDDVNIESDGELSSIILKLKNTSKEVINNKEPVLIYYDNNNMPFHKAWGARVGYFAPGEERCITFYDVISDYGKVEVGFFDRDDEPDITYTDLRDKITFDTEKATEPDEYGEIRINFKGENKYDKEVSAIFEINYYSDDKLIYSDEFIEVLDANSTFETYENYATKFENGNEFPDGYTYEIKLVEAIDIIDYVEEDEPVAVVDLNDPDLSVEDRIESAIHKLLKKNYGDDLASAKIVVDKTYTAEQAKKVEGVKDLELGENDVAFEVSIDLEPEEGADVMQFTVPDGEYDEDSGWVHGIGRLGVLRQNEDGEYEITNYGTGW